MNCPHCNKNIDSVFKSNGSKGGSRSKRTITPEQQAKMQRGRATCRPSNKDVS